MLISEDFDDLYAAAFNVRLAMANTAINNNLFALNFNFLDYLKKQAIYLNW